MRAYVPLVVLGVTLFWAFSSLISIYVASRWRTIIVAELPNGVVQDHHDRLSDGAVGWGGSGALFSVAAALAGVILLQLPDRRMQLSVAWVLLCMIFVLVGFAKTVQDIRDLDDLEKVCEDQYLNTECDVDVPSSWEFTAAALFFTALSLVAVAILCYTIFFGRRKTLQTPIQAPVSHLPVHHERIYDEE